MPAGTPAKTLRGRLDVFNQLLKNIVRRVTIGGTSDGFQWLVQGFGDETSETIELFPGIGFYARPASGDNTEAIVLTLGSRHKVIIATRNEAQRFPLNADESAVANSLAVLYVKDDGTLEARTRGGTAVKLALLSDVKDVRDDLDGHDHTYLAGAAGQTVPTLTTVNPAVTDPVGTTQLLAE